MKKCSTKFCRNKRAKHRTICLGCKKKRYKAKHPMKYAYYTLKGNAKRRNKFFDLTFDQFKQFCEENDYLQGKGKTAESKSIDRKINEIGYTITNLQILSLRDNTRKEMVRFKIQHGYYPNLDQ